MHLSYKSISFAAIVVLMSACKSNQEKTTAVVESITESVYASGIVTSKNQYQVYATVNGILNEILVTEGAAVKKGDVLFKLQNATAQLNKENAQLAAEFADIGNNVDRLNELKVNIELAKSKMSNDSLLLVRQKSLWSQKIGSQLELEQRELAYKNSVTAYESAQLRYHDLQKQIEFASKQSKKNLQISSNISGDYTIKSEIDGRVYIIYKQQGELVTSQMPLAVVGAADEFFLELQIDEYDISKMKLGQKILLTLDSYKGQVFEAEVSKIVPIMNERSRSFTIDATFTKKPEVLYPSLTVEANIVIQTNERALTIPRSFLVEDSFVILNNNERRAVTVGLKDYNKAEILKGLSEGETILKPAK